MKYFRKQEYQLSLKIDFNAELLRMKEALSKLLTSIEASVKQQGIICYH